MDAENVAVEESPPSTPQTPEQCFDFDGHRFGISFWQSAPLVYLAKKARDGDADAVALLEGMTIKIVDADKKQYWPVA